MILEILHFTCNNYLCTKSLECEAKYSILHMYVCRDSLCVYDSGYGTAGHAEDVFYVCMFVETHYVFIAVVMEQHVMQRMFSMYVKLDAKIYIYLCRECLDAGGHEKHIRLLHICKRKDLVK